MRQKSQPVADLSRARISRVLAVADPETARSVIGVAADLAARLDARLDVLSCVEPPRDLDAIARATDLGPDDVIERVREKRRAEMAEALAGSLPDQDARVHVAIGKSFVEIIGHVLRDKIDLVIKAAEPLPRLQNLLFGSTDQHLLRKCPCPVWLRTPDAGRAPRSIIAAVDVDDWDTAEPDTLHDVNRCVVETALRLGAGQQATVHVLHAWEAIGEGMVWAFASRHDGRAAAAHYVGEIESARRRSITTLLKPYEAIAATLGVRLVPQLVRGPARAVIPDEAKNQSADLVVMGTIARTGLSGVIIGNTAEDVLNSVACSVVAVKPTSFVSPIAADLAGMRDP
ncbi:MAG: universal stress protein [Roseibium sp.]|nr:universal stress protein [Roseibium sp.]